MNNWQQMETLWHASVLHFVVCYSLWTVLFGFILFFLETFISQLNVNIEFVQVDRMELFDCWRD